MTDATPTTTQMITTIGATVAKNLLMIVGASAASHGLISGSGVETFVSLGMVLVGAAWSFWNSYGRAIVLAKLDVWKATAQAQADALRKANVPGPTAAQIADKIPDPAVTAQTVTKVMTAGCLLLAALLIAGPAGAAQKTKSTDLSSQLRKGPIATAIENKITGGSGESDEPFPCDVSLFTKLKLSNVVNQIKNCVGNVKAGLARPFADDLRDSLNSAKANNDTTAVSCYTPALALAEAGLGTPAVKDDAGNETAAARPAGPILVFQKFREFVNAGGITSCKSVVESTIAGTVGGAL